MARNDRLIQEHVHDPYFVRGRHHDPSVCPKCNLVFHDGVFDWTEGAVPNARKMVCPACKRIDDNYEGGHVVLEGAFLAGHKEDVVNTVKKAEAQEKRQRPLERIMELVVADNRIEVRTTYEHVARRIGQAVHKAFKGDLKMHYPEGEKFVRVHWRRDH
jgi:hypothetical protein